MIILIYWILFNLITIFLISAYVINTPSMGFTIIFIYIMLNIIIYLALILYTDSNGVYNLRPPYANSGLPD